VEVSVKESNEEDQQESGTTTNRAKRKYRLSPEALAARRANLERARAAPKEVVYRATEKRQSASRANLKKAIAARKSPQGNASARMNALKHGLDGKKVAESVARLGEDAAEFSEHLESFKRFFRPQGYVEAELVRRLAETFWRRLRLYAAQVATEKRIVRQYTRLAPEPAPGVNEINASETERRAEGLLYFFNRYSVEALKAADERREQFQSQIECLLRALVKARGGDDFKMLARRRDTKWLTQLDPKWMIFDKLLRETNVSVEDALKVLTTDPDKIGSHG
jgi:hypothetical protein